MRNRVLSTMYLLLVGVILLSACSTAEQVPNHVYSSIAEVRESDLSFDEYEVRNSLIFWHQRTIDSATVEKEHIVSEFVNNSSELVIVNYTATVEGDYILYEFNNNTGELVNYDFHWRDDLPQFLPDINVDEKEVEYLGLSDLSPQKQRLFNYGKLQTKVGLYYIANHSTVAFVKTRPSNPCWVASFYNENGYLDDAVAIDAITWKYVPKDFVVPTVSHYDEMDSDFNGIEDALGKKMANMSAEQLAENAVVIISLKQPHSKLDLYMLSVLGGEVRYTYKWVSNGFSGSIPYSNIGELATLLGERLNCITESKPLEIHNY